jgi:hypothetical protein
LDEASLNFACETPLRPEPIVTSVFQFSAQTFPIFHDYGNGQADGSEEPFHTGSLAENVWDE